MDLEEGVDVGLGEIEGAEALEALEEVVEEDLVLHEVGIYCSNKDMRTDEYSFFTL